MDAGVEVGVAAAQVEAGAAEEDSGVAAEAVCAPGCIGCWWTQMSLTLSKSA